MPKIKLTASDIVSDIAWSKISKSGAALSDIDPDLTNFPSQAGNSGKVLSTDGESLSWITLPESDSGYAQAFLLMGA